MKKLILGISVLLALTSCNNSDKNVKQNITEEMKSTPNELVKVENFLNTPEQINFNETDFNLSWSSHPSNNYYKQEFIPKDNIADKYKQMIMIELATGNITPKDAVTQKIQELNARKATDKMVNYQVSENKNTNEILLDFILSTGNGDPNAIAEWNTYRYSNYTDKAGSKGVLLFALSKRGYGQDITAFLTDLKSNRAKYVADFIALPNPEINKK
ncbi:MAG: hypothetical protein WC622_06640 [Pedobacter sp.]|jgi:hypothetical protein|uniref:hypothetical protein n=1 Tax=Pedobacter sp. TaxID=1411316 RepID=UPI0035637979